MSAAQSRRLTGFVRLLIAAGSAEVGVTGIVRVSSDGQTATIGIADAQKLVSQGITTVRGSQMRPSREARTWLRRQLADPDRFAAQHRQISLGQEGEQINEAESPLRRLASVTRRGGEPFLSPHHLEAGERIRRLTERAGLMARTTMNYNGDHVAGGGQRGAAAGALSDMAIDARRQLDGLSGTMSSDCIGVLIDVCGFLKGLQLVETERGWPPRSAKLVLRIALDQAAAAFGLTPEAHGPEKARTRLWRDRSGRMPMFPET